MKFPGIKVGAEITITRQVTEADTLGNHLPAHVGALFSTPALVSLMIEAATRMVHPLMPDGFMTVGKSAEVTHDHPSVLHDTIRLTVRIAEFDGYHIRIAMEAYDDRGMLGHGNHVRTIVNTRWMALKMAHRIAQD